MYNGNSAHPLPSSPLNATRDDAGITPKRPLQNNAAHDQANRGKERVNSSNARKTTGSPRYSNATGPGVHVNSPNPAPMGPSQASDSLSSNERMFVSHPNGSRMNGSAQTGYGSMNPDPSLSYRDRASNGPPFQSSVPTMATYSRAESLTNGISGGSMNELSEPYGTSTYSQEGFISPSQLSPSYPQQYTGLYPSTTPMPSTPSFGQYPHPSNSQLQIQALRPPLASVEYAPEEPPNTHIHNTPAPESSTFKLPCPHCDNVYTGNWAHRNLTRHVEAKHALPDPYTSTENGEVLWNCEICEKPYHRKDALLKHERVRHPELKRQPKIPRKRSGDSGNGGR